MSSDAADQVPLADPRAENALLRGALLEAAAAVIDGGWYILGPKVAAFEEQLARDVGVPGSVGVGSGTDALVLAMQGCGVSPGDEVIAPSHTAGPTIAAIHLVGATPVLVDVEPDTLCIAPQAAEAAIGPRTKAIIAVHLYGHPADMAALARIAADRNVTLIEDCAQAQGASFNGKAVGGIGDLGTFSFYPTKSLGALGDGGTVTAKSPDTLARIRWLRTYGWKKPQFAEVPGGRCSRLDEMQAALLLVKLEKLGGMNERRHRIARAYREGLAGLPLALPPEREGCRHVYHLYVVRSRQRDALEAWLAERGIRTGRHYPYPTHLQPALVRDSRIPAPLAETERAAAEILSLPMFATMTDAQVARVIEAVRSFPGHR